MSSHSCLAANKYHIAEVTGLSLRDIRPFTVRPHRRQILASIAVRPTAIFVHIAVRSHSIRSLMHSLSLP